MIVKWSSVNRKQHAYVHRRGHIELGPDYDGNVSLCGKTNVTDYDTKLDISLYNIENEYIKNDCCKICYKRFKDLNKEIEL